MDRLSSSTSSGEAGVLNACLSDRSPLSQRSLGSAHASVPLERARFFANRVAGLTLAQVEDAFRAAKANEQDLHGFAEAVYGRIGQVVTKVQ